MTTKRGAAGTFVALLQCCVATLFAQDIQAVRAPLTYSGFHLPRVAGNLQYGVSLSGSLNRGFYDMGSTAAQTSISGNLAYISPSPRRPFSMVYTGGYLASNSGQPASAFHNLSLSQVLAFGRWTIIGADNVNYLPQSPTTGLSGIPGLGDLGLSPIEIASGFGQSVLTTYATRVNNTLSSTVQRALSGSNSLSASGSWTAQRFVGASSGFGNDNDMYAASGSFVHRLNALSSVSGGYSISKSSYVGSPTQFTSQTLNVQYIRRWSRALATDVSIGPQYTTGSFDAKFDLSLNGSASYTGNRWNGQARYIRTTNTGSGLVQGARSDSAQVSASRAFGVWSGSVNSSFSRNTSLDDSTPDAFSAHTLVGAAQISRQLTRSFSAYASYTLQRQSLGAQQGSQEAFRGISQTVGFGVTYAPRALKFDR